MGGGGGGQTGGAVVQYTPNWAANQAAQYGVMAANAAQQQATKSIQDAIQQVNQQYQGARANLQPYASTGVQAQDQLNQYLGLDPYNPGAAPTAPVKPTRESIASSATRGDLINYAMMNSGVAPDGRLVYYGPGAAELGAKNPSDVMQGGVAANPYQIVSPYDYAKDHPEQDVNRAMDLGYADELLPGQLKQYDSDQKQYTTDQQNWQQNKDWYDRYSSEGPLTSQQISDKISNLPGYQAELQQGVGALDKSASAKGYLGSGRQLKELMSFGQNTLSTFYGNELSRLAGLAGAGQQAATTQAGLSANQGNNLASLYSSIGDVKANASLSAGNALAQAIIAGNQQYKVVGQQSAPDSGGGIGSLLSGIGSLAGAFL